MRRKRRVLRRHIFQDNISKTKGTHSMKLGAYWEYQYGTGTYAYAAPAAAELFSPEIVQGINLPRRPRGVPDLAFPPLTTPSATSCSFQWPDLRWASAISISRRCMTTANADHDNTFHFYWQDNWRVKPKFSAELRAGLDLRKQRAQLRFDQARVPGADLRREQPGARTAPRRTISAPCWGLPGPWATTTRP